MQHFRRLQQRALLLTLRSQNSSICNYHCGNLRKSLLQTRTPKNDLQFHNHSCPFRPSCGFHTSQRHNVHPILWVILKPVFKISAALTGRGVRKWYRGMNPKDKRHFWTYLKERWYLIAGAAGTVAGLFVFYYVSHIQETPITGRKRFVALTHDQIISISKSQADSLIQQYKDKMYTGQSLQAKRVMDVANRLLKGNPELRKMSFDSWQVYVVQDPLVNACVLPTGHVFVFEGMLDIAQTQDELAIILGHEMAHALLEHGIEELSFSQFMDYIVIVLMAAIWCVIPFDGIALVTQWFHHKLIYILTHLSHSRTLEQEADRVGAMLAAKACYDIRHGVVLWKKMEAAQKMANEESVPTFLSTHPENIKRAEFFDFIIPQAKKWRDDMNCPLWPKADPREAIRILSTMADNYAIALKTGQNLKKVQRASIPGKSATSTNLEVSKTKVDNKNKGICIQAENVSIKTEYESLEVKNEHETLNENVVIEKDKTPSEYVKTVNSTATLSKDP